MPEISVIIPVYNVEDYIERCVNSVLSQTFTDFELILIDDGCKDASPQIIDRIAAADPRVVAVHQPNSGVSATRNRGLSLAKGTWITFVDSDDYVDPGYLSDLHELALRDDSDMIVSGSFNNDDIRTYPDVTVSKDNLHELITKHAINVRCPVWGKLFRSTCIKDRVYFHPDCSWSEDVLYVWECLMHVDTVTLTSKINYHYELKPTSISTYIHSPEKERKSFDYALDLQRRLIRHFGKEVVAKHFGLYRYLHRAIWALHSGKYDKRQRIELLSKIHFKRSDVDYTTLTRNESIFKFLLRNKCWLLVDSISKPTVNRLKLKFRD